MNIKTNLSNSWRVTVLLALLVSLPSGVHAASPSIWNGGGDNDHWSNAANWGGNVPVSDAGYDLQFSGANRLTPVNDFPPSSDFRSISFDSAAGAFILSGNSFTLHGDLMNYSTKLQTINNPLEATVVHTITTSVGGGDLFLGGNISGFGAALTKLGAGTLTLAGGSTYGGATTIDEGVVAITGWLTNAGAFIVNNGTLNLSGAMSNGGPWVVNGSDAYKTIINVRDGASVVKRGSFHIGTTTNSSGALNITGGSFRSITNWSFHNFAIAGMGYGSLTVSGGTMDSRGFIFGTASSGAASLGIGTIYGGTVTVDNHVVVPYYNGTAVLTVGTNGTLRRISGTGNLNVNQKGTGRGELNVLGGTVDNAGGTVGFGTGSSPGTGGSGIVNLNAGSLRLARFNSTANGSNRLNFNGGTLQAFTSRSDFVPETFSSVYVNGPFGSFAGGAVVDSAGFDVTIAANMMAPTGDGVAALSVIDGGWGYIGAPYVSIIDGGGMGFGATAIAHMADDGTGNGTLKVERIEVTNPGIDYSPGNAGFVLTGGAPTVPAQPGVVTTTANTSGGLTKLGEGKLTLTGANSYTGATRVSAGLLAVNNLNGSGTGSGSVVVTSGGALGGNGTIEGTVTLESGGALSPGDGIGTLHLAGNVNLSDGGTLVFEIADAVNGDKIVVGGDLTPQGVTTISLPDSVVLDNGDYTLIEVGGTLGGDASRFSVASPNPLKEYSIVYENSAPKKVVLRVVANANLLTWTGSAGNVWNVNGVANWINLGGTPSVFNDNNPVIFNDSGANTTVDITVPVSPVTVSVNAGIDYTFTGAGHIAGAAALSKSGGGALTLSTANAFGGGVTLSEGTLNINNASALGTGRLTIAGGMLDNTSGNLVTLASNNPQAWDADFTFLGSGDLNLGTGEVLPNASRLVTVNNRSLTVGGGISGDIGLTKAGPGTLNLGGPNTYTGATTNSSGLLAITGGLVNSAGVLATDGATTIISGPVDTGTGVWVVGNTGPSMLNIMPGAAVMKNGYFRIGTLAGSSGAVNISGGTLTNLLAWSFNNFSVGLLGYGALTVSGGEVDTRGFLLGAGNDLSSLGVATISGGTVTVDASVVLAYYTGTGVLTVSDNGSIIRTGAGNFNINHKGNGRGEFNLVGGTIDNRYGFVHFGTGPSAAIGGAGILNLNAGTFTTAGFTNAFGDSRVNFNGATLRASIAQTGFLLSTLTSAYVNGPFGTFSGGAIIDTAGFDITVAASLVVPTGQGVSSLAVANGGSGYIGSPYVFITDSSGVGLGATAIANMADDGTGKGTLKVDSIKVTNPGVDYTAGAVTFNLIGGGASAEAQPGSVITAANTSGGLTKLGEGTLTLTGVNTYTGSTTVNAGVLAVDGSLAAGSAVTVIGGTLGGSGNIAGSVTVQDGGSLAPGTASLATLSIANSLSLLAGSTCIMEVDKDVQTMDAVVAGTINYGGRLMVTNLAGSWAVGDTFKLFSSSASTGNFSEISVTGATGAFDAATGVLTITGLVANDPTAISFTLTGTQLSINWPESHKGWYAQSNSVDVAHSLLWFDIPGSETQTSLSITINPSSPAVFYRLRRP